MRRIRQLVGFCILICIVSFAIMIMSLNIEKNEMEEFVPPGFDHAAQSGTLVVPDGLGWKEIDAQVFLVGVCGKFTVMDDTADVWLYNSSENVVWMKLRVMDENGNILGETGLIKPNEYVQSVKLTTIPKVGTSVILKIMAYEPETYYSAGAVELNTSVSN